MNKYEFFYLNPMSESLSYLPTLKNISFQHFEQKTVFPRIGFNTCGLLFDNIDVDHIVVFMIKFC